AKPVSSKNSRLAASRGFSPDSYSPLGMDQAPRSFLSQYGPPMWTRNTSRSPSSSLYKRRPALRFSICDLSESAFQMPPSVQEIPASGGQHLCRVSSLHTSLGNFDRLLYSRFEIISDDRAFAAGANKSSCL